MCVALASALSACSAGTRSDGSPKLWTGRPPMLSPCRLLAGVMMASMLAGFICGNWHATPSRYNPRHKKVRVACSPAGPARHAWHAMRCAHACTAMPPPRAVLATLRTPGVFGRHCYHTAGLAGGAAWCVMPLPVYRGVSHAQQRPHPWDAGHPATPRCLCWPLQSPLKTKRRWTAL